MIFTNFIKKWAWRAKQALIQKSGGRDWSFIVIHHSATRDDGNRNDFEAIRNYHKSYAVDGRIVSKEKWERLKGYMPHQHYFKKPWDDIAYHVIIEKDNGSLKVKQGRPMSKTGAHAYMSGPGAGNFYNENGIGVCVVGNYESAGLDEQRENMLIWIIRQLMMLYDIPVRNVLGHRELYTRENRKMAKTCPGSAIDMDELRAKLKI